MHKVAEVEGNREMPPSAWRAPVTVTGAVTGHGSGIKVWYVTMQFPSPSETFAGSDVRALKRAGADVSVHSLRRAHVDAERFIRERNLTEVLVTHGGADTIRAGLWACLKRPQLTLDLLAWLFKNNRKPDQLLRSVALVPRAVQLFVQIERERPDVVHLFWGHYPALVGYLVQKYLPRTAVSVFLGAYDLVMRYGGSASVARRADVVWTHAQLNVRDIEALGVSRDRLQVVYRGLELSALKTGSARQKVPKRIVSAGRFIPPKGASDVIRAFEKVVRRWPEASLVLLGDGPERETLEASVRDLGLEGSVTFLGHVRHETVLSEMSKAEVFLSLSRKPSERLPNVVKEAIACGCLCVVAETPGIEELLRHKEYGFVVPQDNPLAAADAVAEVFSGRVAVEAMVEAAYAHLTEAFDVDRSMARYHATWKALLAEKER